MPSRRLKVLVSAYACEPGKGSEPGVGWNFAVHLAQYHKVWVLTRSNNRPVIEAELARSHVPDLQFVYHDLPGWARWWKRGQRGVRLYYYLWQLTAITLVRQLHLELRFDAVHHVTFVKYWVPSALAFLDDVHFVWGPVGGGESAPLAFWPRLGLRGALYEMVRTLIRALGELDPLVRGTIRRATLAIATTKDTQDRLKRLGAKWVKVQSGVALSEQEIQTLGKLPLPSSSPVQFLSVGRLLALKGFHLSLLAFAKSALEDAEYWIVGEGPERRRLEALARRLGVTERVRFFGQLPRQRVLELLAQVHALVHPSLHDSGGWVCLEAMASGRPVICLDLGGPAFQVTEETGIKIPAQNPRQVVRDLANAMLKLAQDPKLRQTIAQAGRRRVREHFTWQKKGEQIREIYDAIVSNQQVKLETSSKLLQ